MMDRLAYLVRRAGEAGLRQSAAKLWQKASPYLYWPVYAATDWPRATERERAALKAFGELSHQAFQQSAKDDPSRKARAKDRLELAGCEDFPVLGYGNVAKPSSQAWGGQAWAADPVHGHFWPQVYFARCDFLALHVKSDVKIAWELSRLQWLVWLAESAVHNHTQPDERADIVAQYFAILEDWAGANPAGYGVNWTCGMEVAIRATNLAISAGAIAQYLTLPQLDRVCSILRAHQQYLKRFPEISDVPGNHYLTDLMGEAVLHAALDGLESAHLERALAHFACAADVQFEPEGCHIERATIYHRLTHEIITLPYALALRTNSKAAHVLGKIVDRSAAFLAQLADRSGNIPVFGDQDSGFVLWFGESAQRVDRRICQAPDAPNTDLYSFIAQLACDPAFFPVAAHDTGKRSGFATISDDGFKATLKTGPIGLSGRAAHDHDDALALCASAFGQPLLIDGGCHSYTLDPALRAEFIRSSKHNSPTPLNRERHALATGSINATVRGAPIARLIDWDAGQTSGQIERTDDCGMEVFRAVQAGKGELKVEDRWRFDQPESARILWLFDPAWQIKSNTDGNWTHTATEKFMLHSEFGTVSAQIETPVGSRFCFCKERFSPSYGGLTNCWSLKIETGEAIDGSAQLKLFIP